MSELSQQRCQPCEGGVAPLTVEACVMQMTKISGWTLGKAADEIYRHYQFANFYATMAFVNAVAWLAHQEDHHPDLTVGYNYCHVRYSTHAIHGLSENDFICAAKVNALMS